eukprot:scaffold13537_cov115-Isochrysis_galbana.AAC.3
MGGRSVCARVAAGERGGEVAGSERLNVLVRSAAEKAKTPSVSAFTCAGPAARTALALLSRPERGRKIDRLGRALHSLSGRLVPTPLRVCPTHLPLLHLGNLAPHQRQLVRQVRYSVPLHRRLRRQAHVKPRGPAARPRREEHVGQDLVLNEQNRLTSGGGQGGE